MAGYYDMLRQRRPQLAEIFHAAGLSKSAREQRDREREVREMQERQMKLTEDRYAADQQQRMKTQRAEVSASDRTAMANKQRFYAQAIQAQPHNAEQIMRAARAQGVDMPQSAQVSLPGEAPIQAAPAGGMVGSMAPGVAMDLEASATGQLGAGPVQRPDRGPGLDEIGKRVVFGHGVSQTDPRFAGLYRQELAKQRSERLGRATAGATNVSVGGSGGDAIGLAKSPQAKVQTSVFEAGKALGQLKMMRKSIMSAGGYDAIGSYMERGGAASADIMAKTPFGVSPESRANLSKRHSAVSSIATFRNAIMAKLSGAAISESEMIRMMQSVPDDKDSGPALKSKMETWEGYLEFEHNYGMDALINGLRTSGDLGSAKSAGGGARQISDSDLPRLNELGREFIAQGMMPEQAKKAALDALSKER